ncbi:hypothetical protein NC652_024294 [Populus alba x Populus x berolinensis]|uniref:Uncharacterized protein n=1 Tax=Populus alba x Populus x berolinensis TaxID=444605 RepID=A0AAD6MIW2_9ROSI|nr:hypothetical protein NC652_024294 [Populus alba x Populus x berolinensis]KAJ6986404.1 hypothetical protein NC653_024093 [Populus alba x Populus x berolinensis]
MGIQTRVASTTRWSHLAGQLILTRTVILATCVDSDS